MHGVLSAGKSVLGFFKKNTVMSVAFTVALVTSFIVPPDRKYITYFDFKTLSCLLAVLAVLCALRNIGFFYIIARETVKKFRSARTCSLVLVYITFIGSMLIANDMALLTFLPLGYYVLKTGGGEKYMIKVFVLQNIAANLGGMLTPFGNPQNLYIYSKFNIPTLEFMQIMAPPFALSVVLITLCCVVLISPEPLHVASEKAHLPVKRTVFYLVLFALSIVIVFRVIPYLLGLFIILVSVALADRKALRQVDWALLLTFVFFFVFSGNVARIDAVRDAVSSLLDKSTLLVSVISCQFISNVPSAILLSQFTDNFRELLLGVNVGGVGTLISSLASLITLREYIKNYPEKTKAYIKTFTLFNFAFLIILTLFCMAIV